MPGPDLLAWGDCETTDIDERNGHLLEVAFVMTDMDLRPLDDGYHAVVHYPRDSRRRQLVTLAPAFAALLAGAASLSLGVASFGRGLDGDFAMAALFALAAAAFALVVMTLVSDLPRSISLSCRIFGVSDLPTIEELRDSAVPFVQDMHDRTGLWDRLADGKPIAQVEAELLAYIKSHAPGVRQARLAGNSVALDKAFLREFCPAVIEHLHYRVVDVSTLTFLAEHWDGTTPMEKVRNHDAMGDIRESIAELAYLRDERTRT